MSEKDIVWLEKCKKDPNRYVIGVDNDCIDIWDCDKEESVHIFAEFGYEFAKDLLCYMGCNADFV